MPITVQGLLEGTRYIASPNCDARPPGSALELLVIHNISLPPGEFGGPGVIELFTNRLDATAHPYYAEIAHLRVSAHLFIRRSGEVVQFVPFDLRAWHAGVSHWCGRERCNDFSVGIELEGTDHDSFTPTQYSSLAQVTLDLTSTYSIKHVAGHSDIAPGRKSDPGPHFDWDHYFKLAKHAVSR